MVEKKKFDPEPKGWKLFWRTQRECWRHMLLPYLMYLFMGLGMLAVQAIPSKDPNVVATPLKVILGVVCLIFPAFLNGHLAYLTGKEHYDYYLTGCLHRRNKVFGIESGGDHRVEREYAPWKGFLIGLCIASPVLVFGTLTGIWYNAFALVQIIVAGWSILPLTWFETRSVEERVGLCVSPFYSLLFALLPILVSGVMYIVGAMVEKNRKAAQQERADKVAELAEQARKNK